jgi:hypothetical protein
MYKTILFDMTLAQSVNPMNNKIMRLLICVCFTATACACLRGEIGGIPGAEKAFQTETGEAASGGGRIEHGRRLRLQTDAERPVAGRRQGVRGAREPGASALGLDARSLRSWERGLGECADGLARWRPPKKAPFDTLTQRQLDKIVAKTNNRSDEVLGHLTPCEASSP